MTDIKALTRYDLTQDVETGQWDITPVPVSHEGRYVRYEDVKDILEAEHQRADDNEGYFKEMEKYADKLEKAGLQLEAELAALKGDQVPVAVIQFSKHRELPDGSKPDWNEMPKVLSCNWLPDGTYDVYLHQQKPVVLPAGFYADNDDALLIGRDDAIAAIEAAGGKVQS